RCRRCSQNRGPPPRGPPRRRRPARRRSTRTTTRGRPETATPARARCSLAQPIREEAEDLIAAEVVERLVVPTIENLELAHGRRTTMQLRAARGIDEGVGAAGKYQERNPNVARSLEILRRRPRP